MVVFYFSGTGNTEYIAKLFSGEMGAVCHSIEEPVDFGGLISDNEIVCFCYPVYFSRVPRIMREFAYKYTEQLGNKKIVIICTQMILSGDGARAFIDLFPSGYVNVIYAEHIIMPNNVPNYPWLPRAMIVPSERKIDKCITRAKRKMKIICQNIKCGIIKKRCFNVFSQLLGLPQAVTVSAFEEKSRNAVAITNNCNGCGLCVRICPMSNLKLDSENVSHNRNCTICYRCINKCPQKAITVLFDGQVTKQYKGFETQEV